jgi:hypothetical protein
MQPIHNSLQKFKGQGVFWGKSFDKALSWQSIVFEIDQWVLSQQDIGIFEDQIYLLEFEKPVSKTLCLRRLWGPLKRFEEQIQNNVDGWEAYVVKMDRDFLEGKLQYCHWQWTKEPQLSWEGPFSQTFKKL